MRALMPPWTLISLWKSRLAPPDLLCFRTAELCDQAYEGLLHVRNRGGRAVALAMGSDAGP